MEMLLAAVFIVHTTLCECSWIPERFNYLSSPTHKRPEIRIHNFNVPSYVPFEKDVKLSCDYHTRNLDSLYSLKWYKGDAQFYEYIPSKVKKHTTYSVNGLRKDQVKASSDGSKVTLLEVGINATDQYRCELVAEGPPFHTIMKQANLTVVVLPRGIPTLEGSKEYYYLDDVIVLNCTPPISKPPALVQWYINNALQNDEVVRTVSHSTDPIGLESITSQLNMEVRKASFAHGRIIIRCEASLANLYRENVHITIEEPSSSWFHYNNLYLTSDCTNKEIFMLPSLLLLVLFNLHL